MKNINIGVDTGGTLSRIWNGKDPVEEFHTPKSYEDYIDHLADILSTYGAAESIVIGLPAPIEEGGLINAPNLNATWKAKNVKLDLLKKLRGKPAIKIIQDTEAAGHGIRTIERLNTFPVATITLSTGVGGAVIYPSNVYPLEVGHMQLNLDGQLRKCSCNQLGCVETTLAGWAIQKNMGVTPQALENSDFWIRYGIYLARFLLVIIPLFRLKRIYFFGGLLHKRPLFEDSMSKHLGKQLISTEMPHLTFYPKSTYVGVKGAYFLAASMNA